jgi:hypothetical protein
MPDTLAHRNLLVFSRCAYPLAQLDPSLTSDPCNVRDPARRSLFIQVLRTARPSIQSRTDKNKPGAIRVKADGKVRGHDAARPWARRGGVLAVRNRRLPPAGDRRARIPNLGRRDGGAQPIAAVNAGSGTSPGWFVTENLFTVSGGVMTPVTQAVDTTRIYYPAPAALYQTGRQSSSSATPFSYTFNDLSPGGKYSVRVHFAEPTFNATGARTFNVAVQGTTVLSNYDVFAAVGLADSPSKTASEIDEGRRR